MAGWLQGIIKERMIKMYFEMVMALVIGFMIYEMILMIQGLRKEN